MEQVLFTVPLYTGWTPDGVPIYGFGLMLFVCYIVCTQIAARRAKGEGMDGDIVHDLALVLFVGGLIGARIVYMIQYKVPWYEFPRFWEGGIVFYGSAIGGWLAYLVYYHVVLKKFNVSTWRLGDAIAPSLALGLAIGRVGCLLNGCCYGHVAPEGCPAIRFPALASPICEQTVTRDGLQTRAGFVAAGRDAGDPRTVIALVEPGSEAEAAGLRAGDRVTGVNAKPNRAVLMVIDDDAALRALSLGFERKGGANVSFSSVKGDSRRMLRLEFDDLDTFARLLAQARTANPFVDTTDTLGLLLRGGGKSLALTVERTGEGSVTLPAFTPRTLGVHPTQVYESVSMLILCGFLIAYFPLRRHDGQLLTLLMMAYAVHRFVNEQLRNDTIPVAFGMTLSQNISILIFVAGLGVELWLRSTRPSRRAAA